MEEDICNKSFESGLTPVEDLRDKISFQLHELFSFYEEEDVLKENDNQII